MSKQMVGYLSVVAAATMWGVGGAVAKSLFNQAISPYLLVKVRLLLSFLLLLIGLFFYDRRLLVIPKREIPYFATLGILGMAMIQFFYFLTISLTNVATAVFLQYLSPVFIALYTVIFEKVRLGWRRSGAVITATVGGLLIMLESSGTGDIQLMGIVSGLAAALACAFNTLYMRRAVRQYHPITAITYSFGFGALFWWTIIPFNWEPGIIEQHWAMFFYIVIFSTVIPFLLYFFGLRYLPATNVSVTSCLEPVIAAVVAFLALGETMGWLQIAGGFMVVAAVILLQNEQAEDREGCHFKKQAG